MMKILHINTFDSGGAALCARRIHEALKAEGVESKMLLAQGLECDDINIAECSQIYPWSDHYIIRKVQALLCKLHLWPRIEYFQYQLLKKTDGGYYTIPFSNYRDLWKHPLVQDSDIIHLHWVKGFIDYPTFFKNCNKPIVWTLHDKNPAVGLMHYSSEFFPLPEQLYQLDRKVRRIKRKAVLKAKRLHVVAISKQMRQICQTSEVLKGIPCTLIHNGVDSDVFTVYDKQKNRTELGHKYGNKNIVSNSASVFMFSGYSIWDKNKGLQRVIDALEMVECENKLLVVVGNKSDAQKPQATFPIICTGLVKDQCELSKIYSVADYFILASYEETFAQTPLESMACGTPVIALPCSGAHDLINDKNGVVCSDFTVEALAEGIRLAMSRDYDRTAIREDIISRFSYEKIAQQYIDLYNEIVTGE